MKAYCVVCQLEKEDQNWKHRTWGDVEGWGCSLHFHPTMPEFVPDSTKEDRVKYFNSVVQPYRDGKLSREFVEAHPNKVKGMLKEGAITPSEVRNAKEMWKDVPGHKTREKSL